MVIKYPIFGQDRDKWMFMIDVESDLNSCLEVIDIENKEYIGWDQMGVPIEFYLDNGKIKIKIFSEDAQLERLKEAILDYAAVARPKVPFKDSGLTDNVINLFNAVEGHIKDSGLIGKIKRFLQNKKRQRVNS